MPISTDRSFSKENFIQDSVQFPYVKGVEEPPWGIRRDRTGADAQFFCIETCTILVKLVGYYGEIRIHEYVIFSRVEVDCDSVSSTEGSTPFLTIQSYIYSASGSDSSLPAPPERMHTAFG